MRLILFQIALVVVGIVGIVLSVSPKIFYDLNKKDNFGVKYLWFKHYRNFYFGKTSSKTAISQFRISGIVMLLISVFLLVLGHMKDGVFVK